MFGKIYKSGTLKSGREKFIVTNVYKDAAPSMATVSDGSVHDEDLAIVPAEQLQNKLTTLKEQIIEQQETLERESIQLKEQAEQEVREILERAEAGAFNHIKEAEVEYNKLIDDATVERESIKANTQKEVESLLKEAEEQKNRIEKEAYAKGYEEAKQAAASQNEKEMALILKKLEQVVGEVLGKRKDIIDGIEKQLSHISLMIARKVVKIISENDKKLVLRNVQEALDKIKNKTEIIVRLNSADIKITKENREMFEKSFRHVQKLTFIEDFKIEPGGCLVETDFGEIDARISSQLNEIEENIRNIQPIV